MTMSYGTVGLPYSEDAVVGLRQARLDTEGYLGIARLSDYLAVVRTGN